MKIFSICKRLFDGFGNNPEPVKPYSAGVCCDDCNASVVIQARISLLLGKKEEAAKEEDYSKNVDEIANEIAEEDVRNEFFNMHLVKLVAEMIIRCKWNKTAFKFRTLNVTGHPLLFEVTRDDGVICTQNLFGYNFAYQVKLISETIERAGLFE